MPLRPFWKYEGTANDFVVVEADSPDADLDPTLVEGLCDRHRGVGADGFLLVTPSPAEADPPSAASKRVRMVIRNADGSRPEMCGNGVRCVVLHLALRAQAQAQVGGQEPTGAVIIDSDAGPRACTYVLGPEPMTAVVEVGMGRIVVGEVVSVEHGGRRFSIQRAAAGNPHAVYFAENGEDMDDATLDALGARLQRSELFPEGVNLERVRGLFPGAGGRLVVDVFERGVGRTLACGTGACAVAAVALARGHGRVGTSTLVELPGGVLAITICEGDGGSIASMRGPARRVFSGSLADEGGLVRAGGA